ncbi:hypothetical protein NBRC10512_003971 [Rhodotorula toruloides]|uniref:RHTO0S07e05644g1_1 n=3 Tax=Rhodotorula toruloides TaxID=5286 RepID=A0A061B7Q9_RHOTO|nr:pre-mRNA branch site protein p14 [Rhodotorula toruloides NP11]EMS25176.1 pre-mRNA branch site protein p14 [Rhodotorula toruloides NP11]CDR42933.1 RHTO0S07e05644g1_1 [Rhodotorula toruloides]
MAIESDSSTVLSAKTSDLSRSERVAGHQLLRGGERQVDIRPHRSHRSIAPKKLLCAYCTALAPPEPAFAPPTPPPQPLFIFAPSSLHLLDNPPSMSQTVRMSPDVNRILFVKNMNYKTTGEHIYDLFGKYGSIRQVRLGTEGKAKGTAYVVYEDVMDAKTAFDHLNGFHLMDRYLVVLYHQPAKQAKADLARREKELEELKKKHNIPDKE